METLTNTVDDKMSISLMNFVALQWLRKVNPVLIDIVKTEYSAELRKNSQLADLVPRIAPNIDSLLRRYNTGNAAVNVVSGINDTVHEESVAVNKVVGAAKTNSSLKQRYPSISQGDVTALNKD